MLTGKELGAAIRAAIEKKGVSQVALAAHFNIKPPSVQGWVNAGTIGKDKLTELWAYFADAVGPEHWGLANYPSEILPVLGSAKPTADDVVITQYDAGGAMGKSLVLQGEQPGTIRNMVVSKEWAQKNLKSHTGIKNLCIVTGFGDSMKPLYNPGDPLIVDQGVKSCDMDAVYFFRVENEGFIKRLQRIPGEGIWVLSANKEYKDWLIKKDVDFEVFGRVMKAWRGEDL